MARYRKIDPRIWNDAKFRALSDDAKLILLFILTHPYMTSLGAMRASPSGLAEELVWSKKRFKKAFVQVLKSKILAFDEANSFLWAPNFLKYNRPENPNVVKHWAAAMDYLPECKLRNDLLDRAKAFAEALGEAFAKAFLEAFAEPSRAPLTIQEQEQEQKQEQEHTPPIIPPTRGDSTLPFGVDDLAKSWNELSPSELPRVNLPFKRKPKDLDKIRSAIKRNPDLEWWRQLFQELRNSPFLLGENDRGWKASFDFVVEGAEQIKDGKYSSHRRPGDEPEWKKRLLVQP